MSALLHDPSSAQTVRDGARARGQCRRGVGGEQDGVSCRARGPKAWSRWRARCVSAASNQRRAVRHRGDGPTTSAGPSAWRVESHKLSVVGDHEQCCIRSARRRVRGSELARRRGWPVESYTPNRKRRRGGDCRGGATSVRGERSAPRHRLVIEAEAADGSSTSGTHTGVAVDSKEQRIEPVRRQRRLLPTSERARRPRASVGTRRSDQLRTGGAAGARLPVGWTNRFRCNRIGATARPLSCQVSNISA